MEAMKLRVEYAHDSETDNWSFYVPALNIVGGGQKTRRGVERACKAAIAFALEPIDEQVQGPGADVVDYEVQLTGL